MTAEIERTQRWMQAVITHPGGVAAGIESVAAREYFDLAAADVEQVICRSQSLDSVRRLGIYANAYYARLVECLAAEFPAVQSAAGEEGFGGLVFSYLQQYPSTSYTLGELGRRFPQFLSESRPSKSEGDLDWADFLIDLAILERTYSEVFDGPGEERRPLLVVDELLAIPPERWGELQLQTADSLRLLELRFPVQDYVSAVRRGEEGQFPTAAPTYLAISRRDYVVRRRPLSQPAWQLLLSLQNENTLNAAIETTLAQTEANEQSLASQLETWFRVWTREGYFVGVDRTNDH